METYSMQGFVIQFFSAIHSKKLKIPPHVKSFQRSVILRDQHKNTWPVKARKLVGDWYLLDGWAKFVADSSLTSMDFLNFKYYCNNSGPGLLEVIIFDTKGDRKERVEHRTISYPKEHGEEEDESEEEDGLINRLICKYKELSKKPRKSKNDNNASGSRKPQQRKRNADCLSEGIPKSELASKPKRSCSVKKTKPLFRNRSNKGKGIWNEVIEEDEDEDEESDSEAESIELTCRNDQKGERRVEKEMNEMDDRGKGTLKESSDQDSDSDDGAYDPYDGTSEEESSFRISDLENISKPSTRDVKAPESIPRRKRVGRLEKDFFESGVLPRPTCKYFVKKVNPRRMNEWHIPSGILKDENLVLPEEIMLADPNGSRYTSKLTAWEDGRRMYKGGIGRLCRRNFLTKDDFCICEFGEGSLDGYLLISFVRLAH